VPNRTPDDEEQDDQDERDRDLAAPADLPRPARCGLRARPAVAAAAVAVGPLAPGLLGAAHRRDAAPGSSPPVEAGGAPSLRGGPTSGGVWYPPLERSPVIGVDVGGTKIAAALVNREGSIEGRIEQPTDVDSEDALLAQLDAIVTDLRSGVEVAALGFGIPSR